MATQKKNNTTAAKNSLDYHISKVISGERKFENVFQSITRMILGDPRKIKRTTINGRATYDFDIFRQPGKHIIGMFDEINSFVSFVKDAAEGGSSAEMAFVLIGEPGNGKTFFVDYLSHLYRKFISEEENRRYTFRFTNLEKLGGYGNIKAIESQTFEDPMILAMNLHMDQDKNIDYLKSLGADKEMIERFYKNFRPLGACTDFILNEIKIYCEYDFDKIKEFIEIMQVPLERIAWYTYRKICSQG